jgi:hypothetical protein
MLGRPAGAETANPLPRQGAHGVRRRLKSEASAQFPDPSLDDEGRGHGICEAADRERIHSREEAVFQHVKPPPGLLVARSSLDGFDIGLRAADVVEFVKCRGGVLGGIV